MARGRVRRRPGTAERARRPVRRAAETALASGAAVRDADGSVRLARGGTTLLRPDGTATYQLASVADDLALGITHVIRGSDHRPNLDVQQRIARALGGELPEVLHHGLVLGADGKKLSKRHGHSSVDELREEGFPAAAVRAYLDELGLPAHDVQLDLTRLRRLAVDAIAALPDDELAAAADAPCEVVPALRGARTLVEARAYARLVARAGGRRARRRREADARAVRRAPGASSGLALRRPRAGRGSRAEGGRRRSALAQAGADRRGPGPRARSSRRGDLARRGARTGSPGARLLITIEPHAPARHADALAPRSPRTARADPHVRLRVDRVPARARRQLAPLRHRDVAAELAPARRLRGDARPQHHGRRRQGVRRGLTAGDREPRAVRPGDRVVLRRHRPPRARAARPRAARDGDDPRDRRVHRGARGASDHAYVANGDVYFAVSSSPDYGRLSGARLEDMASQETSPLKRDPRDFALWKSQKQREDAAWDSPWGPGRPGWHIECSAMAEKFLGHEFEIHGGGTDLRFPHHENELAQSAALGHPLRADLDAQRHARAGRGEDVEVARERRDAARRARHLGARGAARLPPDRALEQAARLLGRRHGGGRRTGRALSRRLQGRGEPAADGSWERFAAALDDDFNTPAALAVLHEWRDHGLLRRALGVFGLESLGEADEAPADVVALAERRGQARAARDFGAADSLREEIEAAGWDVRDEAGGFSLVPRR